MNALDGTATFQTLQGIARDNIAATNARQAAAKAEKAGQNGSEMDPRIRETAQDFEAVFLSQMLAPMFEGLETEGYFGGGQAEGMYRSLLVDEIGKSVAQRGGIGIADTVAREMVKMQEE
ncbi:rod-binding protein [Fodinicurvata halophila]|uniref:Rod-binding protein n=1 Tax=Fodinicurvata halophila TaxID=1419723 RepID=A0ABV8UIN9_9PROT